MYLSQIELYISFELNRDTHMHLLKWICCCFVVRRISSWKYFCADIRIRPITLFCLLGMSLLVLWVDYSKYLLCLYAYVPVSASYLIILLVPLLSKLVYTCMSPLSYWWIDNILGILPQMHSKNALDYFVSKCYYLPSTLVCFLRLCTALCFFCCFSIIFSTYLSDMFLHYPLSFYRSSKNLTRKLPSSCSICISWYVTAFISTL